MPVLLLFRHIRNTLSLRHSSSALSSSHWNCLNEAYHSIFRNDLQKRKKPKWDRDLCPVFHRFFSSDSFRIAHVHKSFDEMLQRVLYTQETRFSYVLSLLRSSMTVTHVGSVMSAHCLALKIGVLANLCSSTTLLTFYSRAGDLASCLALFDEAYEKDVIVWNAMITALVQNLSFADAVEFFVVMVERRIGFDSTTLLLVISALTHMNWLKQGRPIHGLGIKTGTVSDSSLCNSLVNLYAKCGALNSAECIFLGIEYRDCVSWNTIITGCFANNCPQKSLWYFKWMTCLGEEADDVTLPCVISASASLEEFDVGKSVHGLAIKLGYNENICVSIANSLVSLYSQCGDITAAETVFRKVLFKDIVSWNSMIDGFASYGLNLEAFDLLTEMQFLGSVQPDIATVVIMIPLCAELCLLREGRAFHGYTIRRHLGSGILVMNSLIDMYSKCNTVQKAELLFKTMPERDVVSWNTMISACSQSGRRKEAQFLFKDMLLCGREFSLSTVLAILPSCDSFESLSFGKSIHCWQLKLGLSSNILATNCLLKMYISCGDLASAFVLLQRMSVRKDVASWNTIINGCASKGHFWEALKAFNMMRQEEKIRLYDSIALVGIISACGNLGLIKEGKSLHGLVLKTFKDSDTQVENSLITMYGRCGDIENAMLVFNLISDRNLCSWNCMISALSQNKVSRKVFELFRNLDFEPNEITIVSLLSACTQLGFSSYGTQIHSYLFRHGFQGNPFVSSALVDMYSNSGRLDNSLKVFNHSEEKSVSAWNSIISAQGFHGNGKEAVKLFDEMCMLGTNPNKSTFTSLLSACGHSGLVEEALWYYNQMSEKFRVEPITEHQVCIVDMLGRCGKLQEAYGFVKLISDFPEPGIWGALLSACNYQGNMEMGKEVAEVLFEWEPENAGYYICMANMYVAAGRWKDAVELRQIVEDKGLKKPAGYSLVDVGFG